MAHRLPVVAVEDGGTVEQVVHGHTGFLTPPDDENALTEALRRLVDNPGLAKVMGRRGYARAVEEFNPKPLSEQYLSLLHAAADRSSRAQAAP
jgi:glycosyltransferase involved in cell wall biosynthesis